MCDCDGQTQPYTRHISITVLYSMAFVVYHYALSTLCIIICLQCFDAVGWAAGMASGL